ncbi:MAG TPA: choice-of-anchor D domain-containing protein, partial [Solirubrobacterales bacterium]
DVYAIDSQSDQVYVLDGADGSIQATVSGADNPSFPSGFGNLGNADLATDQGNGDFYVNNTNGNEVVAEFSAAGGFVSQIGPRLGEGEIRLDNLPNFQAVAVDNGSTSPNKGDVFVPSLWAKPPLVLTLGIYAFAGGLTPTPAPTVANVDPSGIAATEATLEGSVDNEGAQSSSACKFVLALASAPSTPIAEPACSVNPVTGNTSKAVEATVSGLTAGTGYVYSVVATNAGGTATATPAKAFSTAGEAPGVVPNPDPALIAEWAPCAPKTGVTVIVDRKVLGDQKIYVRCALGPQPNGVSALLEAGFDLDGAGDWGLAFICRIDGQPTPAEENCLQTPGGNRYWSYWNGRPGGSWNYSGVGAGSELSAAKIDDVQGWSFGPGGSPRLLPVNGAGPQAFELPPAQESSTRPAKLAREWLTLIAVETAELEAEPGPGVSIGPEERLPQAIALARAGVPPSELEPVISLLFKDTPAAPGSAFLQNWANPAKDLGVDPEDPEFPLWGSVSRLALAIAGVVALGGDPTDVEGADLRGELIAKIDEASGRIRNRKASGITESDALGETAATVEALSLSGGLPAKALKTVDLILAKQDPDSGEFSTLGDMQAAAIRALAAARDSGAVGLDAAIEEAGEYLATLQGDKSTFASSAAGAVGLALAGEDEAAEAAAKRVSRFQVTPEYAGTPDPVTGEPGPVEALIGAFLGSEADLRTALVGGLASSTEHGPYPAAQLPTAEALEALGAAGPYGPISASLSQESVWFGKQTVGTQSASHDVFLTNEDERSLSIEAVALAGGGAGDFVLDGADCLGRTLAGGESCAMATSFAPTAAGPSEALVQVELTAGGQTLGLSLGGAGSPAPAAKPDPAGDSGPPPSPAPQPPGADSIVALKASRVSGRVVRIASLSCPAGAPCQVRLPARARVKIGGRVYRAVVLAPAHLGAGEEATVRLRLSSQALAALAAAGGTVVRLKVEIATAGGAVSRTVRVRVRPSP